MCIRDSAQAAWVNDSGADCGVYCTESLAGTELGWEAVGMFTAMAAGPNVDGKQMVHGGAIGTMLVQFLNPVSYTHLRAHETPEHLVCRLLLEKKKKQDAV
eukprot:TRINITY_DN64461_c0_g1_i1.p2 TRINITY_DN64461_c0_g1~~TRINITY_DN64461_c0_g1_i1.p2  ORF type:complete len:101 (-),score=31.89 TRINITY_DN64461_c0_g1_i1:1-303(-)